MVMLNRGEGRREPAILVERAAKAGSDAVCRVLREAGAKPRYVFVSLDAVGVPPGELDATSTGVGFDDQVELLAFMVARTTSMARTLGVKLDVAIKGLGGVSDG